MKAPIYAKLYRDMPCFKANRKLFFLILLIARWHILAYRGISFLPMVVKKVVKPKNSSILLLDVLTLYRVFLLFNNFCVLLRYKWAFSVCFILLAKSSRFYYFQSKFLLRKLQLKTLQFLPSVLESQVRVGVHRHTDFRVTHQIL